MSSVISLEAFDMETASTQGPSKDFQSGYQEGFAAGLTESQANNAALSEQLVQAIADIEFTFAEARTELKKSLRPTFDLIADKILPDCIKESFSVVLVETCMRAAFADQSENVRLHVSSTQVDDIKSCLGGVGERVTVLADPSVSALAAWIDCEAGEMHVDHGMLMAQLRDVLRGIHNEDERMDTHE